MFAFRRKEAEQDEQEALKAAKLERQNTAKFIENMQDIVAQEVFLAYQIARLTVGAPAAPRRCAKAAYLRRVHQRAGIPA